MAQSFNRPASGFRFKFQGLKTNCAPDAVPEGKYCLVQNGRATNDDEIRCRPGMNLLFNTTSGVPISNISSYSQGTGTVRYLAASNGNIYKDDSVSPVATGFNAASIQSMIPYRPNQSPATWVYVEDTSNYRKISFPNGSDAVLNYKVGIAEPQTPVDAGINGLLLTPVINPAATGYSFVGGNAGTAGTVSAGGRVNDTVGAIFYDTVNPSLQTLYLGSLAPANGGVTGAFINSGGVFLASAALTPVLSGGGGAGASVALGFSLYGLSPTRITLTSVAISDPGSGYTSAPSLVINCSPGGSQISPASVTVSIGGTPTTDLSAYSRFMCVTSTSNPAPMMVQDVFPPIPGPIAIQSIYYYSGATGRCVIVPANTGIEVGADSIYTEILLNSLRRGALVQIGSEMCMVLSVTEGPQGNVCFEVSTSSAHTTADSITGVPAIQVAGICQVGDTITGQAFSSSVATGIGTISASLPVSPFVSNNQSFQSDDYVHVSVSCDHLANLNEAKILFDCGDGSFAENFYYYSIRPSDIEAGVQNTLTQLGVAQLVAQRAVIDEEQTSSTTTAGKIGEANNQGSTTSSAVTVPGDLQWSEIVFPVSALTRVGGDQTKNLQTVVKVQMLVNANATVTFVWGAISIFGGYQVDVGSTGAPISYRIRPRSSITGAKGNPSPAMRYAATARRESILVPLPAAYDAQFDLWDVFRLGGVLTAWTLAGTATAASGQFVDIYDDTTIQNAEQLDFDNLEPWPSIDVPFQATASVVGTTAVVTPAAGSSSLIANYLPGNEVQIGQQAYTLWTRPVSLGSGIWLFQFQENAGTWPAGTALTIYEPAVANQRSRMTWGPTDDGGVVFGLDALRPGTVVFTKNFNPDSAPNGYNLELCPPSEPLMGGCMSGGLVAVGSSKRKWVLRPSFGEANQWTPQLLPGGGLAAPFGMASDGVNVFAVEPDGITMNGRNITTEDLSNLFPIDGVVPAKVQYRGVFYPPDFTKANTFRLSCQGGYLYFNYTDLNGGTANTLVYDIKRGGWSYDSRPNVVLHVPVIQAQSQASGVSGATNPAQLLLGDSAGNVLYEQDGVSDNGTAITFRVITAEFDKGDTRANAQWGDVFLSALPSLNNAMTVKAASGGADTAYSVTVPTGTARVPVIVNVNAVLFSMGLDITAVQTFAGGELPATLYIWQPSYIPQPVVEQGRYWDWDDAGQPGNKFWQGFMLEANTNGVNKSLAIRDADSNTTHAFTPSPVNFPRQSEQAFSFTTPFTAHSVRLEPQDAVNWNAWGIRWVVKPFPEMCETWQTELLSLGVVGWAHLREMNISYIATATVTLTITLDAGGVGGPIVLALPSTSGVQDKVLVQPSFNKWKLISFAATSTAPFALFLDDMEVKIRAWGSEEAYRVFKPFGGKSSPGGEV